MAYTVVFLWISAFEPVRLEHVRDFSAARGLSFEAAPQRRASIGSMAYDAALVDRLEGELEEARTAVSALEEESAETRLSRTEADLLAHPHLPQAGFLMAECLALRARIARAHDGARGERLASSRATLEGPRAPEFGEEVVRSSQPASAISVRVSGLSRTDDLELDGQPVDAAVPLTLVPGLHHVRVWRAQRLVFATFTEVRSDQNELRLPVPAVVPCSADDLSPVVTSRPVTSGVVTSDIACPSWALVRSEGTGIGVALCHRAHCGAFVHWEKRTREPFRAALGERSRFPPWATLAIVGAATAAAAGLVLWQSGAFEQGDPRTTTFRYDGITPQGFRF